MKLVLIAEFFISYWMCCSFFDQSNETLNKSDPVQHTDKDIFHRCLGYLCCLGVSWTSASHCILVKVEKIVIMWGGEK